MIFGMGLTVICLFQIDAEDIKVRTSFTLENPDEPILIHNDALKCERFANQYPLFHDFRKQIV